MQEYHGPPDREGYDMIQKMYLLSGQLIGIVRENLTYNTKPVKYIPHFNPGLFHLLQIEIAIE